MITPEFKIILSIVVTVLSVIFIVITLNSMSYVSSGYVGVLRRLGKIQDVPLEEGLNWINPFLESVTQCDHRIKAIEMRAVASTKDLQTVETDVVIQFYLNDTLIPKMYKKIGDRNALINSVIYPAILEGVKQVTPAFEVTELITNRVAVKNLINQNILSIVTSTLTEDDSAQNFTSLVQFSNTAIKDFGFSTAFKAAIEMKVKTEQEALQAINEKNRLVTEAEAKMSQDVIKAEARAFSIEKVGNATANEITKEAVALGTPGSDALVKYRLIDHWNGVLPKFTGSASVPLLDVSDLN